VLVQRVVVSGALDGSAAWPAPPARASRPIRNDVRHVNRQL
jgi:hypothetical protein